MSNSLWEGILAKYFLTVHELDSQCEGIRQELCALPDFILQEIFMAIDIDRKNFLSLNDFKSFLNENGITFVEENIRKFIHNYDRDADFAINFSEFCNMVLPRKNNELRTATLNRQSQSDENTGRLQISKQGESILIKLITNELQLVEELASVALEMKNSKDFTTYEAFLSIVNSEEKYITERNLDDFLKKGGHKLKMNDIQDIIFRLDGDGDGKISYDEFQEIFFPFKQSIVAISSSRNDLNSATLRYSASEYDDPKNTLRYDSQRRGNEDKDIGMKMNNSNEFNLSGNPLKSTYSNFEGTGRKFIEENKSLMETMREKKNLKEERPKEDFLNFYQSGLSFKNYNYASSPLKSSMNQEIDLRASQPTYTPQKQICVHITNPISPRSTFLSVNQPLRDSTLTALSQSRKFDYRSPNRFPPLSPRRYISPGHSRFNSSFSSFKTSPLLDREFLMIRSERAKKASLTKFFDDLVARESNVENLRESLSLKTDVNLPDLFAIFDFSNRNSISMVDLQEVLKEVGIYATFEELKLLFKRYDFDMDGRLEYDYLFFLINSYREFCEMILPKKFEYAKLLNNRIQGAYFNELSLDSKRILSNLFRMIIECETSTEQKRQLLVSSPGFSTYDCFEMLKKKYSSAIFAQDVINVLIKIYNRSCCLCKKTEAS